MAGLKPNSIYFGDPIFSLRLKKALAWTAGQAVAVLNTSGTKITLSTLGVDYSTTHEIGYLTRRFSGDDLGRLVSCKQVDIDPFTLCRLRAVEAISGSLVDSAGWCGFELQFDTGTQDHLMIRPRSAEDSTAIEDILAAIWPILREDCISDLRTVNVDMCENAMLWIIANRIDVAILVMNARGQVLRSNAAATHLLAQEWVLRKTVHGIRCIEDSKTREFHAALARCASSDPTGSDTVVFLPSSMGQRVPLTMARYWHDGQPTDLITVMMPSPPDSRRVEMLARAGGLTPAEAKVASLLQLGLSNKDAANISGLKEQSVSTYAKRALSKLNVTSRAEMAQMLTWQAAGGHV